MQARGFSFLSVVLSGGLCTCVPCSAIPGRLEGTLCCGSCPLTHGPAGPSYLDLCLLNPWRPLGSAQTPPPGLPPGNPLQKERSSSHLRPISQGSQVFTAYCQVSENHYFVYFVQCHSCLKWMGKSGPLSHCGRKQMFLILSECFQVSTICVPAVYTYKSQVLKK